MQWEDRIGRRIKLQDIHILLAAVQWGSMAKAAQRLAISQPVISRSLANLELTLGVRLLDRSRNGVEPTPYGRTLLTHGLAAFDDLKRGVKAIEFLANPNIGEVRIGTTEVFAGGILSIVVKRILKRYPSIDFNVTISDTQTLQHRILHQREVDFLLVRLPDTLEEECNAEMLLDDRLYVVASNQSPWSRRRKIKLADLTNERWIFPPLDSPPGIMMSGLFRESGLQTPRISMVTNSIQLTNALVAGGALVLYPGSLLRSDTWLSSFKILPVKLPFQRRPVGLITLKNRTPSPVAEVVCDCLRKVARSMGKGM
jgi:DNA-binding transcriptional LysR family regulator